MGHDPTALKDEDAEHPIAVSWRPVFRAIVDAFVDHDYMLANGIDSVEPVSSDTATQIREYVDSYGATLVNLSDETWNSSVAQWMGGHWDVLVDLWTAEEGRSDLVLDSRVQETDSGYSIEISSVYVP